MAAPCVVQGISPALASRPAQIDQSPINWFAIAAGRRMLSNVSLGPATNSAFRNPAARIALVIGTDRQTPSVETYAQ